MASKKKAKNETKRRRKGAGKANKFRAKAAKRRAKLAPKTSRRHLKTKAPQSVAFKSKSPAVSAKIVKKIEEQNKKAEALMVRGRARGFVTYDEILKSFPNIEEDVLFLEDLYEKFSTAHIDVLRVAVCSRLWRNPWRRAIRAVTASTTLYKCTFAR